MEVQEMRQVFIDSAVRVVARDGLEKTTTKAIASEAKLNEAYIYKCFSGKDDLLSAALHMEDVNFANLLQKTLPVMHMPGLSWKERAYILWKRSWDFILNEQPIVSSTFGTIIPQAAVLMHTKRILHVLSR